LRFTTAKCVADISAIGVAIATAAEEGERGLAGAPFDARSVLPMVVRSAAVASRPIREDARRRVAPARTRSMLEDRRVKRYRGLAANTRNRGRRRWRGRIGNRLLRRRRCRGGLRGACRDKRRWNDDRNQRGVPDFFGDVRHLFPPELCKSYNNQPKSDLQQKPTRTAFIGAAHAFSPRVVCPRRVPPGVAAPD
jgi:hypothetical protein